MNYSYQGQDLFVVRMLNELTGGFFLDSGASDGRKGSNSLLLESEFGWSGICVEPNAELFADLSRHRTCICIDCVLYDRDCEVEFVEAARVYGGILDEYQPEMLRQIVATLPCQDGRLPLTRKHARTVESVLDEYRAPAVIDYWSLDTEGSELAILRAFPWHRYKVRVLTVEHNYGPDRGPIHDLLATRGLRWVGTLGIDDCYIHSGHRAYDWRSAAFRRG